ncbi:platelet-derived growth factor subunit A isoform X2 [Anopheles cruzii]|uniref:platelet-derived growth factor subunit A isoform X2 n=1 Tax=Anopheles cruzii TaxID=68878 RepID=UPI0022EC4C37|nr:platelet-derived growth factor subunit A isoform X2 [Anopheles cruzii]
MALKATRSEQLGLLVLVVLVKLGCCNQLADRVGAIIFPEELTDQYDPLTQTYRIDTLAKEKRESPIGPPEIEANEYVVDSGPQDDSPPQHDGDFKELPISYAKQLLELRSSSDLLSLLDPDSFDQRIFMNLGEYTGRDVGVNPVPASCEPESQLVSLRPENLTGTRYYFYPTCTRVKLCSGCCNTNQLVCEAVAKHTILYKVIILEYRPNEKDRFSHLELVPIEEHVKCKCQCRIKETHCNEQQVYNPSNCRCECNNREERNRCLQERQLKQWNPATCSCDCLPRPEECTSGSLYDPSACKCLPLFTSR